MKRLFALILVLGLASQAGAWWWPPTGGTVIEPAHPTSSDVVTITIGGDWPDSCAPYDSSIRMEGQSIYFDVAVGGGRRGCADVITAWSQTKTLGPLSPGTYTVYAGLLGDAGGYVDVGEFVVTAAGGGPPPPQNSLVAHWRFDEGEGDIAYDSAGNNDGVIHGATWTSGQIDGALYFDGLDDFVELQDDSFDSLGHNVTFSAWIKRDRTDVPRQETIVGYADEDGYNNFFYLMIDSENRLSYKVRRSSSRDECYYFGPTPLESGRWYHVAVAVTDSDVVGYINGVPEVFTRHPGSDCPRVYGIPDVSARAENASIGNLNRSPAYQCCYFMGKMDEVMIFDKTLSAEECIQLYEGSLNGLVAHWKFDEGSGMIAHDSAGNNDGVIHGAQWTTGQVGGALEFAGQGHYVEIPDDDSLTPASEITISYWINKRAGTGAGISKCANCPNESASPGNSRAYRLNIHPNTEKVELVILAAAFDGDMIISNAVPSLNAWHHIVGTFSHGAAAIYIDGQLDNSAMLSVSSIMNDVQPLTIAAMWDYCGPDNLDSGLYGLIDDVRIYDRALSAQEIEELYGQPLMPDLYHVDADNGDDDNDGLTPQRAFATIQKSIDSAKDDDTVIVADGTYIGPGNRDLDFGGRAITVRSLNGPQLTIIDCESLGRGFYFHSNEDADSVVEGFTITNGLAGEGGGVYCSSSPTIYNCIIKRNRAENGGGLAVRDSADPIVANCIIAENSCAGAGGGGIDCSNAGSMIINCTIAHNSSNGKTGGILCTGDSNPIITNCILWADLPGEIYLGEGASAFVTYCDVQGGWPGEGNIHTDPCFVQPEYLGPICYWKFDEGSGMIAHDSAGDNDGVVYGAQWTTGLIGGALDFDGIDDYVEIPDDDSLTPNAEITIAYWVYKTGSGHAGVYKYAQCVTEPASPGSSRAYSLQVVGDSDTAFLRVFSDWNTYDDLEGDTIVSKNEWHHIAGTFDSGNAAVYVDGQLDGSTAMSVTSIMNDVQPLTIGAFWSYCGVDSLAATLRGKIDDVRIYDRGLSAGEIERLYQNGQGESTDYHLLPGSPCINAGDPDYVSDPEETDLEGNHRISGKVIDMGAYEYQHRAVIELSAEEFEFTANQGGANPIEQILAVGNSGQGTLNWQIGCDCDWLSAEPDSGRCRSTGDVNDVTLSVLLSFEGNCFPETPEYAQQYADFLTYVGNGADPSCWCAPPHGSGYQCDGDGDGALQGFSKYRVYIGDLNLLVVNWRKKITDPTLNPCADFDHKDSGFPAKFRVYTNDLRKLIDNWKKKDSELPGDCPRPD